MKVANIVPGSGGTFYCENCLRDSSVVKAMRRLGADVYMVPMYLPMFTDDAELGGEGPVFFGGINVFLQQKFGLFRKTPRWFDRWLDARPLLKLAARHSGSTRAAGLGEMTLSMIQGRDGKQAKEVNRLLDWLRGEARPDLVHLSSVMLIGLAPALKEDLGVPVVCSLQDEDTWLDALEPPHDRICWRAMADRIRHVDTFIAVSDHYGQLMRRRLGIEPARLRTIHVGIDLDGFGQSALPFDPPVLGYLSKISPSLGFDKLLESFVDLKRRTGLEGLKLRAAGGLLPPDRPFVEGWRRRLRAEGMDGDLEIVEEMDRAARLRFLESLTLMSVPMPAGEAFGTFMLESWAAGVPVVQPRVGAFPELVELTGGGVLYDPDRPDGLTEGLASLLAAPDRLRELGSLGREAVRGRFDIERMARDWLNLYEETAGGGEQTE